jgi:hypothetical protein
LGSAPAPAIRAAIAGCAAVCRGTATSQGVAPLAEARLVTDLRAATDDGEDSA